MSLRDSQRLGAPDLRAQREAGRVLWRRTPLDRQVRSGAPLPVEVPMVASSSTCLRAHRVPPTRLAGSRHFSVPLCWTLEPRSCAMLLTRRPAPRMAAAGSLNALTVLGRAAPRGETAT